MLMLSSFLPQAVKRIAVPVREAIRMLVFMVILE